MKSKGQSFGTALLVLLAIFFILGFANPMDDSITSVDKTVGKDTLSTSANNDFVISDPESSDYWKRGYQGSIDWTWPGSSAVLVDIYLFYHGGGNDNVTIADDIGNDGSDSWPVPYSLIESNSDYWVIVFDASNYNDYGVSAHFDIYPTQTISLTKPDTSSSWVVNDTQTIEWTWDNYVPQVDIELFMDDVFNQSLATTETCDGSFSWKLPNDLMEGSKYQIKIKHSTQPTLEYGFSDYFTVLQEAEEKEEEKDDDTTPDEPVDPILITGIVGGIGAVGVVSVLLVRRKSRIAGR